RDFCSLRRDMELSSEYPAVLPPSTSFRASCQDPDSAILLSKIAQGDPAAFWKLWTQNQGHLLSICCKEMGGNRADAEDALSIAMLRALDRLPYHANAIINAKAWLIRLTSNLCKEIHRTRLRQNTLAAGMGAQWMAEEPLTKMHETPEDSLLRQEILDCLKQAIQRLPLPLRDPFILRLRDELPSSEIATLLELSSENVRKRIQVARAVLKGKLRAYLAGLAPVSKAVKRPAIAAPKKMTIAPRVD